MKGQGGGTEEREQGLIKTTSAQKTNDELIHNQLTNQVRFS